MSTNVALRMALSTVMILAVGQCIVGEPWLVVEQPVLKGQTTGLILEVRSGRLLGLTLDPEKSRRSILYGVDVTTGQVLFTKDLPSPVSADDHWPHWIDPSYEYNALVHGPDGFVWTYLKDVLVRIDPKDASMHVVGRINPVGWPTFVGNGVYFSGLEQLRRIRNLVW